MRVALAAAAALVFLCCASTASAAGPPEAPETGEPTGVTATTVTLGGTLNPHAPGAAPGEEYVFFYSPGGSACNEGAVAVAPASEPFGMVGQAEKETVFPPLVVESLEPNTLYTVCLAARYPGEEWAYGNPRTFKTPPAPPSISGETASAKATEARIEGFVNPSNELTECFIQYGKTTVSEHTIPCEPEVLKGPQSVGATATGLEPGTAYHYRIVAENEQSRKEGKAATGAEEEFKTALPPEAPVTDPATEVSATVWTLHGTLNPGKEGEAGTYQFVYRQSATECQGTEQQVTPAEPEHSTAAAAQQVSSEATGLLPGTTYTFCLLASNGVGETAPGAPQSFKTPAVAATVSEESFSDVGSSTAVLHAQVNPGGALTSFFFEYGPTSNYTSKTPLQSAGAAPQTVGALANLENLSPNTTYHFRIVASNTEGPPAEGKDTTFSTYPTSLPGLPDNRGYELVSPLNTGSDITVLPGGPTQSAADGNEVIYVGTGGAEGGNGGGGIEIGKTNKGSNAYLAKRSPTGGWTAENLQPSGLQTAGFQGYSIDLSQGFLASNEPLFEGAPEGQALYTRDNANGSFGLIAPHASYSGSTADGSHVLLASPGTLDDSVEGKLKTVSVLPDGTTPSGPVFGSPEGDLENVISSDGARIFWSTTETVEIPEFPFTAVRAKALYVREEDTSPEPKTMQVDAAEPACPSEVKCVSGGGVFRGATPNGSRVFFTDENKLTANSTAAAGKPDLYRYDVNPEAGKPGTLTDLTPDADEPAAVAGVLGASEDGTYVYFAAAGALATNAQPQACPLGGQQHLARCNVYVIHNEGAPQLVATVRVRDGFAPDEVARHSNGDWIPSLGSRSAHVSADGQHLGFMSSESLTGFDSKGNVEIYMYDLGSGVSCVSCNPSGAPSQPESNQQNIIFPWSSQSTYALRDISGDSDRIFFESDEPLVPALADANMPVPLYNVGLFNVYEWERDGSGSCTTAAGCIYLLSGGTSSDSSFFIDASAEGNDVFIGSRAQLVPQDHGEAFEVYDARVGAPQQPVAPACSGAGCQGVPAAPPIFATPSSATFNGAGNFPPVSVKPKTAAQIRAEKLAKALKVCRKNRSKRKRSRCQKSAHRRYGPAKASRPARATNDRRAN